jgi:iduronate 2-sulfatase
MKTMTRTCVFLIGLAVMLPGEGKAAPEAKALNRPNVLFIAVDDLRTSLGCYGDHIAKTPNMDRLAEEGLRFSRAYCQQAVCGPSRVSLLTGLLPDRTRVWHNRNLFRDTLPDVVTLPQLFKHNGYHARSIGKVFSGRDREAELDPQSWSVRPVLKGEGWRNYVFEANDGGDKKGVAYEAADVDDDGYSDGKLADLAIETLEGLKEKGRPFFLAVGFFKPHLPFNAPKKYWDLYDPAVLELREAAERVRDAPEMAYHSHRELGGYRDMPPDEKVTPEQARTLRHGYYACVSYVDAQVGKVLAMLPRLGLEENTIVVLWGDHGYALGEEARWCKGTNFELDTRVPLIIRVPGMTRRGTATEALIEYVDIYPTLAELAGLPVPGDLDGTSLVPILQDPRRPGREVVLSQFSRPFKPSLPKIMGYSIRTDTHRYTRWVRWPDRGLMAEELYDYASPAGVLRGGAFLVERQNLVQDPTYAEERDRLRLRMDRVLRERMLVSDN